MVTAITVVHILMCFVLIMVILLQAGKGADMGAIFGGSSQTVFGSSGAGTFLSRITTACAIIFMVTSLALAALATAPSSSIIKEESPVRAPLPTVPEMPTETEIPPATPATEETTPTAPAAVAPTTAETPRPAAEDYPLTPPPAPE